MAVFSEQTFAAVDKEATGLRWKPDTSYKPLQATNILHFNTYFAQGEFVKDVGGHCFHFFVFVKKIVFFYDFVLPLLLL